MEQFAAVTIFVVGRIADTFLTIRGIRDGLSEGSWMLGSSPSSTKLVAHSVVFTLLFCGYVYLYPVNSWWVALATLSPAIWNVFAIDRWKR